MKIRQLHSWPVNEDDAIRIQNSLKDKIITNGNLRDIKFIAGVDTSFSHKTDTLFAAVCLYRYHDLTLCEKVTVSLPAAFPYIPGLYAFREGPVILKALARLKTAPDVIIFAGHGIAHPRSFGLAAHLGLLVDIPSIGCARKKLSGEHQEIGSEVGDSAPLCVGNNIAGLTYRSRKDVKPIYISPGYKCSVADASRIVTECLRGYRIPEPLRTAHRLANQLKNKNNNNKPQTG